MADSGKTRRIAFRAAVALVSLFLFAVLISAYPLLFTNWLPADLWLAARDNMMEADTLHRLHSLALGLIAWGMLLGIAMQAHQPARKVSLLLGALAVPLAIALSEAFAGTFTLEGTAPFFIAILAVIVLHPAAGSILRLPKWDFRMLGLSAAAAVPWGIYAVSAGRAARSVELGHEVGHLTFMSALSLLAVFWGIIAASSHSGWRFAAAATLIVTVSVALQSVIFPGLISGISFSVAVLALLWSFGYGAAAILRGRAEQTQSDD